jgi:alkylation response protein AidB-like acyl-CoA dehydrogenase
MEINLSDELKALRETAARFADVEIAPYAQEWDRLERYPDEMIRKLGDQGFMGVLVPEAYGGAGGSYAALAIVLEEIARHDGGLALAVEAHNSLCCEHIFLAGTDEQKARFLPPLATGRQIGSWCLTEPGSGSDAASIKTRAVREGKDWILNGSKQFITNGSRAGIYVVMATTPQAVGAGISAFIVERGTPGLTTGKPEEKLGMRSSDTVSVSFQDVRLPPDRLLGTPGRAFEDVKKVLERGRIMISAVSLGLARGAMEESARYAHERSAFGRPIVEFQQIQAKIAEMAMNIEAARLLLSRATRLLDEGVAVPLESAITKLFTSEMATRACLEAIQIHGGYGYLRSGNVERYMRDAKLCEIGEGTSEILRVLITREVSKKLGYEPPAIFEHAPKRAAS